MAWVVLSATAFAGSDDLLQQVMAVQEKIRTIDCAIEQIIHEGGSASRYAGRYRADSSGRFRIDYREPSEQTVVNTSSSLLWYIRESGTLFVIPARNPDAASPSPALAGNFVKKIDATMKVHYLGTGFHGFFTSAHRFLLVNGATGIKIEMTTGIRDNIILEKRVRDRDGREVMREIYSEYREIDTMKFPHRVDVFALTERGVTRSISKYRDVVLNSNIPENIFVLKVPGNAKVMTYGAKR